MRKWLMRLSTITIVVLLLNSHQGLLDSVSNFMIDGVVPLTSWALGSFLSAIAILFGAYFIYKSVVNLRFEMLKRSAILYNKHTQTNLMTSSSSSSRKSIAIQADELDLVKPSLTSL